MVDPNLILQHSCVILGKPLNLLRYVSLIGKTRVITVLSDGREERRNYRSSADRVPGTQKPVGMLAIIINKN